MRTLHSPSMTAIRATSHEGWSQKWLHVSEDRVFCARSSAYGVLDGLPWAQGSLVRIQSPRPNFTGPFRRNAIGRLSL
jgi:hypothetical protein